jgi:hypothetical protein
MYVTSIQILPDLHRDQVDRGKLKGVFVVLVLREAPWHKNLLEGECTALKRVKHPFKC